MRTYTIDGDRVTIIDDGEVVGTIIVAPGDENIDTFVAAAVCESVVDIIANREALQILIDEENQTT